MLNNLEEKIIKKIKDDKVCPLSPAFFMVKKILRYLALSIFLLLAGLSLSILIMIIRHGDWDIYAVLGKNPWSFFLQAFPYFWLFGVLIFLGIAFDRTRKSDEAYHYPFVYKGLLPILLIIITALILYFSGISHSIESYLANNYFYRQANYLRSSWENPDKGLLAGTVELKDDKILLHDFSEKIWELKISSNSFIGQELLQDNKKIKVIGSALFSDLNLPIFEVKEVRTWECACPHCAQMKGSCSGCLENNNCSGPAGSENTSCQLNNSCAKSGSCQDKN